MWCRVGSHPERVLSVGRGSSSRNDGGTLEDGGSLGWSRDLSDTGEGRGPP